MSSQVAIASKKNNRRMWPVMGFLLIVALTLLAYTIAPNVIDWIKANFRQFRTAGMTDEQLRLAFTAIVFVLFTLVVALIIAVSAPKKAINVNMDELSKERVDMLKGKRARKKRQRRINREYREHVEGKNK